MRKTPAPPFPTVALAFLAALGALLGACAQQTHEERVAEMRSRYTAELKNFIVREEPEAGMGVAGEEMAMEGEAMDEGEAGEAAGETGDEMAAEEAMVPVTQKVLLDVLVRNENQENLPWLTLDVEQVDADEATKGEWRIYVDTSTIGRGPGTSVTHTLEDIDYQAGDGFTVSVRHPVPEAERGDYPEFSPDS